METLASNTLQEFLPFPKLPLELRIKIWHLAAQERRTIEIHQCRIKGKPKQPWTDTPLPSLLSVCRESRLEGLNFYTKLKIENKYYCNDDGSKSDAGSREGDYDWEFWEADDDEDYFSDDYGLDIAPPVNISSLDKVPTLRAYVNPYRDIIYFNLNHNHVLSAVTHLFRCIGKQTVGIQNFALSSEALIVDPEGEFLANLLLYNDDVKKVILVNNDSCSPCDDRDHSIVTGLVEVRPRDENETKQLASFVALVKSELEKLQRSPVQENEMPETGLGMLQRKK
jgi:hypothetical protein